MPERIGHFREDDAKRIGAFFRRRGDRKQARPRRPRRRVYPTNGAAQNQNPDPMPTDPTNNNDINCCEFGQLFICPLPNRIAYEVLCSAIDPPIDGMKMHKVRFFSLDRDGIEIRPDNTIFEHKVILMLPCTEEVCRHIDLSSVTLNGNNLGVVTYGNQDGCCGVSCNPTGLIFENDVRGPGWLVLGNSDNIANGDSVTMTGTSIIEAERTNDRWFIGPSQEARFNLTLSDITIEDPTTQNYPGVGISASINLTDSIALRVVPLDVNDERRPENVRFPYSIRSVDDSFQNLGIEWSPGDRITMLIKSSPLDESTSAREITFVIEINGSIVASETFQLGGFNANCSRIGFGISGSNVFDAFLQNPTQFTGPGTIVVNGISVALSNTPS